jgi:hypothetical protein
VRHGPRLGLLDGIDNEFVDRLRVIGCSNENGFPSERQGRMLRSDVELVRTCLYVLGPKLLTRLEGRFP